MTCVVTVEQDRSRGREAVTNEPPGFRDFVVQHRTNLVRYAALPTGSIAEAEDIVQDVLVRLVPRWDGLAEPLPYVWRSVTNEFLSWRRRWSTRNIQLSDGTGLDRPVMDDHDDGPDPQLWTLLLTLPRQQRSALVLRYYEDLDDDEIAELLSCRVATVRSHVHRGISAIRKAMDAMESGEHRA